MAFYSLSFRVSYFAMLIFMVTLLLFATISLSCASMVPQSSSGKKNLTWTHCIRMFLYCQLISKANLFLFSNMLNEVIIKVYIEFWLRNKAYLILIIIILEITETSLQTTPLTSTLARQESSSEKEKQNVNQNCTTSINLINI